MLKFNIYLFYRKYNKQPGGKVLKDGDPQDWLNGID